MEAESKAVAGSHGLMMLQNVFVVQTTTAGHVCSLSGDSALKPERRFKGTVPIQEANTISSEHIFHHTDFITSHSEGTDLEIFRRPAALRLRVPGENEFICMVDREHAVKRRLT